MLIITYIVIAAYLFCLVYITMYCLFQFHLLIKYKKGKRADNSPETDLKLDDYPLVTIQLPMFNEYFVVDRLIDNIVNLDYPKSKIEIHVLDDSTDETLKKSEAKVDEYAAQGFNIKLIHRKDRKGYKAGALKDAMKFANGEFIAIF